MCGIGGQFCYADGRINTSALQAISQHMIQRGPDGDGIWTDVSEKVGFVHRRLSIIDVSDRAAQPMQTEDGRLIVTFNGEIYNYRALCDDLIQRGYRFRTSSDTEVLLHLYDAFGPPMVERLRGMFAFAIYDTQNRCLMLARDGYGIKPLYYADDGRGIMFASQVKALMSSGRIGDEVDPAGLVGFYLFGSVPEPFTWRRSIKALPAGSTLTVQEGGTPKLTSYFSVAQVFADAEESNRVQRKPFPGQRTAALSAIQDSLASSIRHHLVADVPVGIFLSAGVDSGALLGMMRDATDSDIQAVTLAFDEFEGHHADESPLAEEVARRFGARHVRRCVSRDEFLEDLPKILDAMDQPSIDGLNTWFVSKAAKELGLKVAISGLGGDELFAGYPSFRDIPRAVRTLGWLGRRRDGVSWLSPLVAGVQGIAGDRLDPKLAALLRYGSAYPGAYLVRRGVFMPDELSSILDADTVAEGLEVLAPLSLIASMIAKGPHSPYARVAALEAQLYMRNQLLRDSDWASMAHSLEVRVPLVDTHLLAEAAPYLVAGEAAMHGKSVLATAPQTPLPDHITNRAKTGFTTPIADWLKADRRTQSWQSVAKLAKSDCRWARRWAFSVWNHTHNPTQVGTT